MKKNRVWEQTWHQSTKFWNSGLSELQGWRSQPSHGLRSLLSPCNSCQALPKLSWVQVVFRCRAPISSWQIGHGQAWQDLGQSWGVKFYLSQDCTRTGGGLLQIERKSCEITWMISHVSLNVMWMSQCVTLLHVFNHHDHSPTTAPMTTTTQCPMPTTTHNHPATMTCQKMMATAHKWSWPPTNNNKCPAKLTTIHHSSQTMASTHAPAQATTSWCKQAHLASPTYLIY